MKQEDNILKLAFEYGLSKIQDEQLNQLLNDVLTKEQKINALFQLSENQIKVILSDIGFDKKILDTL